MLERKNSFTPFEKKKVGAGSHWAKVRPPPPPGTFGRVLSRSQIKKMRDKLKTQSATEEYVQMIEKAYEGTGLTPDGKFGEEKGARPMKVVLEVPSIGDGLDLPPLVLEHQPPSGRDPISEKKEVRKEEAMKKRLAVLAQRASMRNRREQDNPNPYAADEPMSEDEEKYVKHRIPEPGEKPYDISY